MGLLRRRARWLAACLAAVLLCAQLATSAYACPAWNKAGAVMAPMPGCDGHMPGQQADPDLPQLCKAHCQQGAQAVGGSPAPDLLDAPLLWAVLDWAHDALHVAAPVQLRQPGPASGEAPPGAPPLYLSLLVLRN